MKRLEEILRDIEAVDEVAKRQCEEILNSKMKPKGSLGVLEKLAIKVAGIKRMPLNELKDGLHIVVAGDNGVVEEEISPCPMEYTRIVSEEILSSLAGIGVLCKSLNIPLKLIDVGIDGDIKREYENLERKKIAYGTKNFLKEPALTEEQVLKAIMLGIDVVLENDRFDFFSIGEMGIGNTTTSSAILYALTRKSIDLVVGYGSGINDEGLKRKKQVVKEVCEKYNLFDKKPIEVLRVIGGFDIATMVGICIGASLCKKIVLLDGFISVVAALVAVRIEPKIKDYLIATHMSEEKGMRVALDELGYEPFLNLKMRLGEGTGAVLAYPILKSAVEIPKAMKTKEEIYALFK